MSAPIRPSILPQCSSCARRFSRLGLQDWRPSSMLQQQQVRGKKKMVQAENAMTVRLLKDVNGFGRKGTYVPVSVGQMRNLWFPQRIAEYVPLPTLKQLSASHTPITRDFDFTTTPAPSSSSTDAPASVQQQVAAQLRASTLAAQRHVESNRVSPSRATDLVDVLVPHRLDFMRSAIEATPPSAAATAATTAAVESAVDATPAPPQQKRRGGQDGSSAASILLAARASPSPPLPTTTTAPTHTVDATAPGTPIYGSVSTADVAAAIKELLAQNEEASKVLLGDEDVKFVTTRADGSPVVGLVEEGGRVKVLGEFEAEIRIKGAETVVRRVVRVLPLPKDA